jgi:hypothetical protein
MTMGIEILQFILFLTDTPIPTKEPTKFKNGLAFNCDFPGNDLINFPADFVTCQNKCSEMATVDEACTHYAW